jgi:hypothetical protein
MKYEVEYEGLKSSGYSDCKIYYYKYKFGKPDVEGTFLKSWSTYDKESNVFVEEKFYPWHWKKLISKYNENDKLIEDICYDWGGDICENSVREYNDHGLLVRVINFNSQGQILRSVSYIYKGNVLELVEDRICDKDGTWLQGCQKYNEKGLLVEETEYLGRNFIFGKVVYIYNDKDSLSERIGYSGEGKLCNKTVYSYNDNNLLVNRTHYDKETLGKGTEGNRNQGCRKHCSEIYEYDNEGRVITQTEYNHTHDPAIMTRMIKYKYVNYGLFEKEVNNYGIGFECNQSSFKKVLKSGLVYMFEDRQVLDYNDKGLCMKVTEYDSFNESIEAYVWEYK